jgi:hypothetical protein
MQTITTIGLDIAKSVFQVHGVDADGDVACLDIMRDAAAISKTDPLFGRVGPNSKDLNRRAAHRSTNDADEPLNSRPSRM